jgi:hypothetical protein
MRRVVLLLAPFLLVWTPSFAAEWETEQIEVPAGVSNVSLGSTGRAAAVDGSGRVHLAYQNNLESGAFEVLYSVRNEAGEWAPAQVISPPGRSTRNGSVAVDQDGEVHVFWEDVTGGVSDADIGHRVRNPDGSWEEAEFLFPAPQDSRSPVAAVDAFNRIHLVWVDGRFGIPPRVLYSRADADRVWSTPQIISIGGLFPDLPSIDADGFGNVHVVWSDRGQSGSQVTVDIVYLRINPSSGDQPEPVRLVRQTTASAPSLEATAAGTLHLVWLDDRDASQGSFREIYYKRFLPDIGWGKDKRFTYDQTDHQRPIITEGARNTLNVVWEDYRTGNPEIYYRQITWETGWDRDLTRLTVDNSASESPSLVALADGELLLVWSDRLGTATSRIFTKIGNEGPIP